MTGEEKRQQLKEQYKQDLIQRKAFLEKVRQLSKIQRINKALSDMESAITGDDSDEWIQKLNQDSAINEAQLDMALDQALKSGQNMQDLMQQVEKERASATDLVKQMKKEMGLPVEEEDTAPVVENAPQTETEEEKPEEGSDSSSKKTLGDF